MFNIKKKLITESTITTKGIYAICNTINGKFYIGRAVNEYGLENRRANHLSALKKNKHRNSYLQNSFNKYGESAFEFWIIYVFKALEEVSQAPYFEQLFINFACPHYNAVKNVFSAPKPQKGQPYFLISPNKKICTGKNLSEFCRRQGLDYSLMRNINSGSKKSHKGWTNCFENHLKLKYYGHTSEIKKPQLIKDPYGKLHKVYGWKKFIREKDLRKDFIKLLSGDITTWKKWSRLTTYKEEQFYREEHGKPFLLISPGGRIVEGKNLNLFCQENGLDQGQLNAVVLGKNFVCHGWTANFENYLKYKYYGVCSNHQVKPPIKLFHCKHGVVKVFGRKKFCEKFGLNTSGLTKLVQGKIKKHKGWRLAEDG